MNAFAKTAACVSFVACTLAHAGLPLADSTPLSELASPLINVAPTTKVVFAEAIKHRQSLNGPVFVGGKRVGSITELKPGTPFCQPARIGANTLQVRKGESFVIDRYSPTDVWGHLEITLWLRSESDGQEIILNCRGADRRSMTIGEARAAIGPTISFHAIGATDDVASISDSQAPKIVDADPKAAPPPRGGSDSARHAR